MLLMKFTIAGLSGVIINFLSTYTLKEYLKINRFVSNSIGISLALFVNFLLNRNWTFKGSGTKWNFIPFKPGLVGGHCIGVDPYYLTHKAKQLGLHPELISAGRRVNDAMPKFVAEKLVLSLVRSKVELQNAKILVLGVTFKEKDSIL
mgnify:CR=1 FL=1